jgi:hypothetical protein
LNDGQVRFDYPAGLPLGLASDVSQLSPNRGNRFHDFVSLITAQHELWVLHFSPMRLIAIMQHQESPSGECGSCI